MRKRIEAYHELKYTALNCWIETDDIPFLVNYILADLVKKRELRKKLWEKKSRLWAILVISHLSKINSKTIEVLEKSISSLVRKRIQESKNKYDMFLQSLDTDDESKELLKDFLENTSSKLLIIPLIPKFEELSCVAIDHSRIASKYWIMERVVRIIKLFKENPRVFYTTQWSFTIKEDSPYIRKQIEQIPRSKIH